MNRQKVDKINFTIKYIVMSIQGNTILALENKGGNNKIQGANQVVLHKRYNK